MAQEIRFFIPPVSLHISLQNSSYNPFNRLAGDLYIPGQVVQSDPGIQVRSSEEDIFPVRDRAGDPFRNLASVQYLDAVCRFNRHQVCLGVVPEHKLYSSRLSLKKDHQADESS